MNTLVLVVMLFGSGVSLPVAVHSSSVNFATEAQCRAAEKYYNSSAYNSFASSGANNGSYKVRISATCF